MKHAKLIAVLSAMLSLAGLSGCATYGGLAKDAPYTINLNSEDLVYGDIVTYEETYKYDRRFVSIESLRSLTVAYALQKCAGYDFLLFPQYIVKYKGSNVTVTVTGRLAKIRNR